MQRALKAIRTGNPMRPRKRALEPSDIHRTLKHLGDPWSGNTSITVSSEHPHINDLVDTTPFHASQVWNKIKPKDRGARESFEATESRYGNQVYVDVKTPGSAGIKTTTFEWEVPASRYGR